MVSRWTTLARRLLGKAPGVMLQCGFGMPAPANMTAEMTFGLLHAVGLQRHSAQESADRQGLVLRCLPIPLAIMGIMALRLQE